MQQRSLVQSATRPWQIVCLLAATLTLIISGLWYQSSLGAKRTIEDLETSLKEVNSSSSDSSTQLAGLRLLSEEQERAIGTKSKALEELRAANRRRLEEADSALQQSRKSRAELRDQALLLKEKFHEQRNFLAIAKVNSRVAEAARGFLNRRLDETAYYLETNLEGAQDIDPELEMKFRELQVKYDNSDKLRLVQSEQNAQLTRFRRESETALEHSRSKALDYRKQLEREKKKFYEASQRASAQRKKLGDLFNEKGRALSQLKETREELRASRAKAKKRLSAVIESKSEMAKSIREFEKSAFTKLREHPRMKQRIRKLERQVTAQKLRPSGSSGDLERRAITAESKLAKTKSACKNAERENIDYKRTMQTVRKELKSLHAKTDQLERNLAKQDQELSRARRLAREAVKDAAELQRRLKATQRELEKTKSK
ncbi:MAG: hypothetical protein V3W41_13785 [Planctomycetota bacterium]